MTYLIRESLNYQKIAKAFLKKHNDLIPRYRKTLEHLEENPFHPALRLHKLSGKLQGYHSVSITMQYRITLEFEIEGDIITLINIGGHEKYS